MVAGMNRQQRVSALEQADGEGALHCIARFDNETVDQAVVAFEAEHGAIASGRDILRVILTKPGARPVSPA